MKIGVNIGNTFENTYIWETGWGQPVVTKTCIDGLAAKGIKTVRLPVAWDTYAVNGVIPAAKMTRIKEVVKWITDAGMYCVLNIHWDGGWINSTQSNNNTLLHPADAYRLTATAQTKFESYWRQIASEFPDIGERLIFEALNEEGVFYVDGDRNKGNDYTPLNQLNQLFVYTVRDQGGWNKYRNLLISGFGTGIDTSCVSQFATPSDPAGTGRLFLSVHYYSPALFAIASTPVDWGGWKDPYLTWGTTAEKDSMASDFATLKTFCDARGMPAIIGEFACPIQGTANNVTYTKDPASRVLWMKTIAQTAFTDGNVPVLWDTGGDIDRATGYPKTDFANVLTQLGL